MYYSFYMNERMLLDNWKYYQEKGECNWLLKRTLMEDNTRTPAEKMEFYIANRRVVNEYADELKQQAEQYLDVFYIERESKNVFNQGNLRKYVNYLKFKEKTDKNFVECMNRKPKRKLREHTAITIYQGDLDYIKDVRKCFNGVTIPQIEIMFGIIFFCRMNGNKKANLSTEFKKKQFLGCFKRARMQDLDAVLDKFSYFDRTQDNDYSYDGYNGDLNPIEIKVTLSNNKLDLTKMAHEYIPDILNNRCCEMCLELFEPKSNRQRVCSKCKKKADSIKAKYRKIKQRYKEAHGDACCGKCTDCIQTDCSNWWSYWYDEFDHRCLMYKHENKYPYPRYEYPIPDDEQTAIFEKLIYDIQYTMTEEEKSKIIPWDISCKYKSY